VCIIGQTIVNNLFPEGDAVGKTIRIRNLPFKVLGILSSKGFSIQGNDQDDMVVIPYTSAMKRFSRQTYLAVVNVQAVPNASIPLVELDIANLLHARHHIAEGRDDDFNVRDQQEIADAATATTRTMTFLLGAIACVSLVVGGIGIMNIMLVSVTERTREIGIRMAVGAHGSDILTQFLIESVVLSLTGGLLGIAIGILTAKTLSHFNHWPTVISPSVSMIAFLFSGAVGVFFGYYPALKAARLDPIDALRFE